MRDTRFKPGQSGNPGGRPKGAVSLTSRLRARLTDGDAKTIIENLIALATRVPEQRSFERTVGNGTVEIIEAYDAVEVRLYQWAVDTILERLDGKVKQTLAGDTDRPFSIILNTTIPGTGNGGKRS